MYHHLIARGSQVKIPPEDLARYDENIRNHLEALNRNRREPIILRYFQYLAALYTEIILDYLFNHKPQLLSEPNTFLRKWKPDRPSEKHLNKPFTETDLNKLAFWMATGSGKTLLLHLNYYQFRHYNRRPLDNILLITPNEGLSEQHLAELEQSGILAGRFGLNRGELWASGQDAIQVIEIGKLVEEKLGGGVCVPVEAFEGYNLIFVDEGHKGAGGKAWRKYRDDLGATGFTFEYSATFGQALAAARDTELLTEYGKCIVFDYSYRYFYGDGYGKDFRILNLKTETREEQTDLLLLGNLLSFYEQLRLYQEQTETLRPYNLERPLCVFVGGMVNAVYTENKQPRSDVLTVARFLHRVLRERDWAVESIGRLLKGESGLTPPNSKKDLFADRFPYLRKTNLGKDPAALYEDLLRRILHASAPGGLHLYEIRTSAGELGLRAAHADKYFGLIYVGDPSAFKQLVEQEEKSIKVIPDTLSESLFAGINRPESPIHILIGARKFMEGWNSWRVSSMGLLNVGREEGSQIIQLFGRGVRLKGKDMSLKRSSALPGPHPEYLNLLETLNIFAVRADYMAQFREYLEREGVETEEIEEIELPVLPHEQIKQLGLVIPRLGQGKEFTREEFLMLGVDRGIHVRVDLSSRIETLESGSAGIRQSETRGGSKIEISQDRLDWVDWEQVYLDLLAHKEHRGLTNLVIRPDTLRKLFTNINYTLMADEAVVRLQSFAKRELLQGAVTRILCKYVDALYRKKREHSEANEALVYQPLEESDPNLSLNRDLAREHPGPAYVIRGQHSKMELVKTIEKVTDDKDLPDHQQDKLLRIDFDCHLYQPLLVGQLEGLQVSPTPLNRSEAKFVYDLGKYWEKEKYKELKDKKIFLLRNLSRGRGVGFFEERGFYPDFILWIVEETGRQRIVFIEPHGMLHARAYMHDEKARLHERLCKLAEEIGRRSSQKDIVLDSYIISATSLEDLRKHYGDGTWNEEDFAQRHILFQDEERNYIRRLFQRNPVALEDNYNKGAMWASDRGTCGEG